jgi:hypothetical protein
MEFRTFAMYYLEILAVCIMMLPIIFALVKGVLKAKYEAREKFVSDICKALSAGLDKLTNEMKKNREKNTASSEKD